MIPAKQIILWLTVLFACLLPASALTPCTSETSVWEISSIGYDAPTTEVTDLASRAETPTSNYDTAPIPRAITEEIPIEANRTLFGSNIEFKAADTTPLLTQGSRITDPAQMLPATTGAPNDIIVIGRQPDTKAAADWAGHKVLSIDNWTPELNDSFISAAIKNNQSFYLASPINYNSLWNAARNSQTIYARELGQIYKAGYTKVGDYLHPPTK